MISKRPSGAITSRNVAIIGAILGASFKAGSTIENSGVGAANIASLARPSGRLRPHYGAAWGGCATAGSAFAWRTFAQSALAQSALAQAALAQAALFCRFCSVDLAN